jgi:hypothetical protein
MVKAKVVSDVGAVAEAINQGLRLIRDLIDPDKNDKRDDRKRIKNLLKARNVAINIFTVVDDLMKKHKSEYPKEYAWYLNSRDAFDKARRRT